MAVITLIVYKTPTEIFPISLTYWPPDLPVDETITVATAASTPTGLTLVGDVQILDSARRVAQVVSGGTVGIEYQVLFNVQTSGGRTFNNPLYDAIQVRVV